MTRAPNLNRIQARHWVLVAGLALVALVTGAFGVGGVLGGGGTIGGSVLLYALGLRALLTRTGSHLAIAALFVKLAAFLGLGWLVFAAPRELRPDPVGFALGLTCFPIAAVWEALTVRERH